MDDELDDNGKDEQFSAQELKAGHDAFLIMNNYAISLLPHKKLKNHQIMRMTFLITKDLEKV